MCTRYFMDDAPASLAEILLSAKQSKLAGKFLNELGKPVITQGEARPTDIVPVIATSQSGKRAVFPMKWGFTNPAHKSTIFNARTETAGIKPTFREAWESRRCIVPASYYFEWEHFKGADGKTRTGDKYAIQPAGDDVTWLCGLYRMEGGLPFFVILTREPGEGLSRIHDRMPFILPENLIDDWISPTSDPNSLLGHALTEMVAEKTE